MSNSANDDLRNARRDAEAAAMATPVTLVLYSGTPPATAGTALSGNTALATHSITSWNTATPFTLIAGAIANATITGSGTNTVTFGRLTSGSKVQQLLAATSGAPITVSTTSYVAGGTSSVTSVTVTFPAA